MSAALPASAGPMSFSSSRWQVRQTPSNCCLPSAASSRAGVEEADVLVARHDVDDAVHHRVLEPAELGAADGVGALATP